MSLDTEAAARPLMSQVEKLLGKGSPAAQFAALLYGPNGVEGLGEADPEWLARNVRASFEFIAKRPKGRHKIRLRDAPAMGRGSHSLTTVLEIANDDMPFLVDSVMAELQARGLSVLALMHPIFRAQRDKAGRLQKFAGLDDSSLNGGRQESYIALHLQQLPAPAAHDLATAISGILDEVRVVVSDWKPMLQRLDVAAQALQAAPGSVSADLLSESLAFLAWLRQDNFTFLGLREFELVGGPEMGDLVPVDGSGLGALRNPDVQVLRRGTELVAMTPEIRRFFFSHSPLIITKANVVSRVHRRVHMDYIGIKTYRSDGTPKGEIRIVGLFTSQAYVRSPREIPFLRHKVARLLETSGYPPNSHGGKALLNILETFPRDELVQISDEQLREWVEGILDLETRPRVRVFARIDRFDRFVSLLIYVPRERYNSTVRERIGALLADTYKGRVAAFYPYFPDGPLVRVQFIIGRYEGATPQVDVTLLERRISDIVRTWEDQLAGAIKAQGERAHGLLPKYSDAFSASYADTFLPERALEDIKRMERLGPDRQMAVDFYCTPDAPVGRVHAAVFRFGGPIRLSERVPVLENLGFSAIDERSYKLTPRFSDGIREITLHDMVLETSNGAAIDLTTLDPRLEECFLAVFRRDADNDGFNRLVVSAGADWREAAAIRAYAAYLRQLGSPFGLRYLADTINRHAGVARDLLELFHVRFDPDRGLPPADRQAPEAAIRQRIEGALANVPSLDEDRILRQFLNLVIATVRTSFYQEDDAGARGGTIAFKFDSKAVDAAPQPRPFREIWVYSPRVEGIHLRFAPIARGGIRWSDRAQDFRTEVLSLVRAQLVKNAVIVPSGAKGGFLPKLLPGGGSRDEIQKEGIAAYRIFISALLDITDNLKDGKIVPPRRVVRHDADDAYLVVAADKGTATFSDIANEISAAHGFWLGDAFASGGSAGYDHKAMAITARGAWECVKRHFREMDIDIQKEPFRVVGVGDMSGDVFGNGMLLSEHIQLVAAFDHRDIFIDPNPTPHALLERKRLFDLPRSSWQDYDKTKISRGGGVFPRSAKAIAATDEMRSLLGVTELSLTPVELMRALLKCETDLLWFGGIGTYVRGAAERDEEVGDRANDGLRVTATDLKARVVGEGANLGVTQRGRIEFASRGGRINTDFIDNSAGVNTSDQEVNIKIAIGQATRSGKLSTKARRDLLTAMTEDVAQASLRNNYQQSLALSLAERRSQHDLPDYSMLMRALETRGLFERGIEALPSNTELQERGRAGRGLTRPELAVLMSFAKIALQHDLLESAVPDNAHVHDWLLNYFPSVLRERFTDGIENHSLRREIIAIGVTNALINRGGPAMAARLADETRASTASVALAFLAVRDVFELPRLWQRIDALDGKVKGAAQLALYQATQDVVNEQTLWFLRNGAVTKDLAGTIGRHKAGLAALEPSLDTALPTRRAQELAQQTFNAASGGVPREIASDVARLQILALAPAITELAEDTGHSVPDIARVYFTTGDELRIAELAAKSQSIATTSYYDRLAIAQALSQLASAQASFTRDVIVSTGPEGTAERLANGDARLRRVRAMLDEIAAGSSLTVSQLLVAAGQLADAAATNGSAPAPSARPGRTRRRARSAASESRRAQKPAPRLRS